MYNISLPENGTRSIRIKDRIFKFKDPTLVKLDAFTASICTINFSIDNNTNPLEILKRLPKDSFKTICKAISKMITDSYPGSLKAYRYLYSNLTPDEITILYITLLDKIGVGEFIKAIYIIAPPSSNTGITDANHS